MPEVVERLVGEPAGERAVTDHGDDRGRRRRSSVAGDGQPVRVAEGGGGVAVLDEVVLGLGPRRVARQAAGLAEPLEAVPTTGDELVHVGLVAGVPHDGVAGRVEDPVQRQGELDRPEVGAEVPAVAGDRLDQHRPDLVGEHGEVGGVEPLDGFGGLDECRQKMGGI